MKNTSPDLRRIIAGTNARVTRNALSRFTAIISSNAATLISASGEPTNFPALLMSTSTAPGLCESTGLDGTSTRLIWLQVMSLVLMGLGLAHFARRTLVGFASLLEYTPVPVPNTVVQPVRTAPVRPAVATPQLSPINVALKGGLLEQRRAA